MIANRKKIWIILRLVILTFLIIGVIDISMLAGSIFRDTVQSGAKVTRLSDRIETKIRSEWRPYDPFESFSREPGLAENIIKYKRLHVDVDPNQVAVSYDVYLRKDHPLFLLVERETSDNLAEKLANEVLGAVSVSDELLKFGRVETEISDTDDSAHIYVAAAPYQTSSNQYQIRVHAKQFNLPLSFASKEILVHTQGVNVRAGWPYLPVSKTQDDTRYVLPADADWMNFFVDVTNPTRPETQSHRTLAAVLQKGTTIPGLDHFIYGLLEAIPFILFIIWCKRNASEIPNANLKQEIIKTYLIFHFSYFFFYSLNYLIEDWRSPFIAALSYFERRTVPVFAATTYKNETSILLPLMAMFLYVWPTFARAHVDPGSVRTSRLRELGTRILAALLFVGLLALAGWLLREKLGTIRSRPGELTVGEFYLLFFAVLILAIYVFILLLGRSISLPKRLGFSLTLFSVVMLLLAADLFYPFAERSENRYLRIANGILSLAIFAACATAITWTFAVLCYRAVTSRSLHSQWKVWTAKRRFLLVVVLLAVSLSTRSWSWPMRYWPLWSLAWELKDLFFLILVWFLATTLRKASAEYDWLRLPESVRDAGILLALCLFYSPTTRWNYIPVSFIMGFFLLKFWLLPQTHFDRNVISDIKSGLSSFIERTISFNDAQRALNTLKKELLGKLGKGDLEPKQYSDKLRAQVEAVDNYRQDLMVQDQFAKDYVLALGPGSSAWKNGLRTALYSLLFSIPWSLLYLRDLVRAPATSESYLLLDLLNNILFFLLAWVSYGFIFGYFYPYIRGKNGMRKGAVMFLTIILPELVWTALARTTDAANWVSFGFWTLQIFIHTMLLGLIAGDYAILRSNGFMWGHLLDFYRLRFLSAWASSMILAIAAAAGTLITSGATEILASALKYVGVIPENVELPKK